MFPCNTFSRKQRQLENGFTLLEVMVALAILAIALSSIIKIAVNQSVSIGYLRDKTFAHWVAMNQIAEMQLTQQWPPIGKKRGTEEMGQHTWHWQSVISSTPDDRVRQLQINVFRDRDDESPVTFLTSFLAQP